MSYVIYVKETSALVGNRYKTLGAAKSALTRLTSKWFDRMIAEARQEVDFSKSPTFLYGVAEFLHYRQNIEKMVVRKNLMSGKEYVESINTPISCSPASVTYWSM